MYCSTVYGFRLLTELYSFLLKENKHANLESKVKVSVSLRSYIHSYPIALAMNLGI